MSNSRDDTVRRARAAVVVAIDALAILKKEVPGGLRAPVDEKVRARDFSDYMIDLEGEI